MSDWLERELSKDLAPVVAPQELGVRLGFAKAKRRVFPRTAFAVAAGIVMMMAGGVAASREARNGEVEFVSVDRGAIAVWLGHQGGAGAERNTGASADVGCKACHRL